MAGGMSKLLDAAAAAARRATRRRKMAIKKRSKSVSRQPAAAPSGGADPRSGNVKDLNVATKDPERTLDGLRYLLKKELRKSDVSHLGRIVLPKKESEDNLPSLKAKEGIVMVMDDYTNFQAWTFKYRYWPNNKSRMYILENTGDYVTSHELETGDFIILYKDDKNDRYVIRAKKAESTDEEEEAAVAVVPDQDDEIFDFIVPELSVNTAKYSDLFQPLSDGLLGMGYDHGQGYDFMRNFPPAPFMDDSTCTGSTSFTEPVTPLFGWKP